MFSKNKIFWLIITVIIAMIFETFQISLVVTAILLFILISLSYEIDCYNDNKKEKLNKFIKDIQNGKNVDETIDKF